MPDKVSERIKKRRKEIGLSLQNLEYRTGISRSTLQRYETQGTSSVGVDKLERISYGLEVDPSYLLGWDSKELPYKEYECIIPLLKELKVSLEYDSTIEQFRLEHDGRTEVISHREVSSLKKSILKYTHFMISHGKF